MYASLSGTLSSDTYQDKNAGACTIECPVIQWQREKVPYYDDRTHFARPKITDDECFELMRFMHSSNNWKRIAPFPIVERLSPFPDR